MALSVGTRLGSYDILGALGAGGMGEVYRARDTKLGRDVAIKILPELFAADSDRVARFRREAQLLAALNHPNIAAVYGLDDAGATRFIVMELVEGESLDARLKARAPSSPDGARGFGRALPVAEALSIARQIVDALEAAHEKGIVHRDLKPANVMLTEDGRVKVLDFGLAKLEANGSSSGDQRELTHSPTLTFAATQAGVILGTAAYMSPEQARGRPADKRSDVWAFGCVLYEMLASKRAFDGDDATDIIAAVVRAEPDWAALPSDLPPRWRTILEACLQKDRKARIPDISVVRFLMSEAGMATAINAAVPRAPSRRVAVVGAAAAFAGAVTAAFVTWTFVRSDSAARPQPARFSLGTAGAQSIDLGGPDRMIAISPDGSRVVAISRSSLGGGGQLLIRRIDQLESEPVRGLDNVRAPFISRDGRWIGFFEAGELKKVAMSGGPPIAICQVTGGIRGATWGADDTIVFASNDATTGLFSVSAAGGTPKLLTKPDTAHGEVDHFFPAMLPGGRAVLFTVVRAAAGPDDGEIAALDLRTGQRKTVIRGGTHPEYVEVPFPSGSAGYLLYASNGALRAVRFDRNRLETDGDPMVVVDRLRTEFTGAAQFSVARNGSLVYGVGGSAGFQNRSLVWVNRRGEEQAIDVPLRQYGMVRISPDGTRAALSITGQESDIWVLDLQHVALSRLTFGPALDQSPVWMPDGTRILFSSSSAGIPNVFWQRADNTGSAEQLTKSGTLVIPYSVSPDGKLLVVSIAGGTDIGLVHVDRPTEPSPLIDGPASQINAEISPDGRWVAYQSAESGQYQVYVRPFPDVNSGRWQITTEQSGGVRPMWSRTGQELFYITGVDRDRAMMAVRFHTTPTFQYEKPTRLFAAPYSMAVAGRTFDLSPDGQKFLMIKDAQTTEPGATPASTVIVLDWFEELRQRTAGR